MAQGVDFVEDEKVEASASHLNVLNADADAHDVQIQRKNCARVHLMLAQQSGLRSSQFLWDAFSPRRLYLRQSKVNPRRHSSRRRHHTPCPAKGTAPFRKEKGAQRQDERGIHGFRRLGGDMISLMGAEPRGSFLSGDSPDNCCKNNPTLSS